jgi:hypothetical protein
LPLRAAAAAPAVRLPPLLPMLLRLHRSKLPEQQQDRESDRRRAIETSDQRVLVI